jgi:hypothetical protein
VCRSVHVVSHFEVERPAELVRRIMKRIALSG